MKKAKSKTRRAAPVKPQMVKPPRLLKDVSREPYGRRALVAAAAEIFSERGYEAASLHDICAMAGSNGFAYQKFCPVEVNGDTICSIHKFARVWYAKASLAELS